MPTLTYKAYIPPYSDNAANPDGVSANSPGGGFTWDGRADTLAQQAAIPLLSSFEMANTSQAAVVPVVQNASYAALFQQAYGANVFSERQPRSPMSGWRCRNTSWRIPASTPSPASTTTGPRSSSAMANPSTLTAAENRGYAVFNYTGNCFACHYNGPITGGGGALFTDFTYENTGAPRNPNIPANATRIGLPTYYDLGLCTAVNPDPVNPYLIPHVLPGSASLCGVFKTPTLRNTATRNVFFHNGVFTSLAQVIDFYNTRDTNPAEVVSDGQRGGSEVQRPSDRVQGQRRHRGHPFGLTPGATPYMTAQNEADLLCFLETLTDGYVQGVTPQDPNCVN